METRALAIAFFYAIGTATGGIVRPAALRPVDPQRERRPVALGFFIGAAVMAARRDHRDLPRRPRGAAVAGEHRAAADRRGGRGGSR